MSDPVSNKNGREALRGAEVRTVDFIFEALTSEQLAELLRTPLERAAAEGKRDLALRLARAGAEIGDALHEAVGGGHGEIASDLVASGVSLTAKDRNGWTPLHRVAALGDPKMLQLLLLKGANKDAFNNRKFTPLFLATSRGQAAAALALLAAGADVSLRCGQFKTPVMNLAAQEGHIEILKAMIEHGADVEAGNCDQHTALHAAVSRNQAEAIDVLVGAGANIEARNHAGRTPLHTAAHYNSAEAIHVLVGAGANIEARNCVDNTPLHAAAFNNNVEAIDMLVEAGANIEARDIDGSTPLRYACIKLSHEALLSLLKHGATVNARNDSLKTPLMCAARKAGTQGAAEVVDSLLRAGADETFVDNDGNKASDVMGEGVGEEDRLAEDVERVHQLLANAPADRAWRRRGYLVLCHAHPDRVQQSQVISVARHTGAARMTRSRAKRARERGGAGDSGLDESTGGDWAVVMAKVLQLQEEGIFRTIVGYM